MNKFSFIVDPRASTRANLLRLTDTMTGIAANEPNFPLVEPSFVARTLAYVI